MAGDLREEGQQLLGLVLGQVRDRLTLGLHRHPAAHDRRVIKQEGRDAQAFTAPLNLDLGG